MATKTCLPRSLPRPLHRRRSSVHLRAGDAPAQPQIQSPKMKPRIQILIQPCRRLNGALSLKPLKTFHTCKTGHSTVSISLALALSNHKVLLQKHWGSGFGALIPKCKPVNPEPSSSTGSGFGSSPRSGLASSSGGFWRNLGDVRKVWGLGKPFWLGFREGLQGVGSRLEVLGTATK